jgi:psiF repeat
MAVRNPPAPKEITMKTVVAAALALVFALGASTAFAADAAKTLTPQQQRMKDCNVQAKGKKGDERKAFMSTCLKGGKTTAAAKPTTQQEKMKSCSADAKAKSLTGDARKKFMSTCLKGDGAAAH